MKIIALPPRSVRSLMTPKNFLSEVQKYFPGAEIIQVRKIGDTDMTTLNFTIANLYDPKPGKKVGSIKTQTGEWISYWPSDKGQFQEGASYSALCDARDWEGKTYYTVKSPGKGGNIQMQGQAPQTPQAASPNQPAQTGSKDDMITRIAIAKSCIEAHESMQAADAWYAWVMRQEIPTVTPVANAGGASSDLDDEIPF